MEERLLLDKERSLSEIIDDSYQYIRLHFIELIKRAALAAGPFLLVSHAFSQKLSPEAVESSSFLSLLNLLILFGSQALLNTVIYGYLIHSERDQSFEMEEVWSYCAKHFFLMLSTFSSVFIVLVLGLVAFVIPGIYLFVPLSMIYIHRLTQYSSFTESFTYLLALVKNNWFASFKVLLLASLVLGAIGLLFLIPLLLVDENSGTAGSVVSALCYTAYSIVTAFVAVPVTMQYFNLKRKLQ